MVIERHHILRTALHFDIDEMIIQHCMDMSDTNDNMKAAEYPLTLLHYHDRDDIEKKVDAIINDANLFHLSKGHVIRCHLLKRFSSFDDRFTQNNDVLSSDDLILFCIHHSVFDGVSTLIFYQDLARAYDSDNALRTDDNTLQYIDYAVHEHQLDMTSSQAFWKLQLQGHNLQHPLLLPTDRHRSSADQRSALASVAQLTFDNDLSSTFLSYASSHDVTPFQLGLAAFYVFLFKLSHGQSDLCLASINANRYRSELENMIGMFVATLPYRLQLHSHWSFDELVKHVREKCLCILEHSHYPLQHILSDMHENQTSVSFLETVFDFITSSPDTDHLSLGGTTLKHESSSLSSEVAKFDMMCVLAYHQMDDGGRLSCRLVCCRDMYDEKTVTTISQRFHHLLHQLFSSPFTTSYTSQSYMPIYSLSLILPEEAEEMQGIVFGRLLNVVDEGMSF